MAALALLFLGAKYAVKSLRLGDRLGVAVAIGLPLSMLGVIFAVLLQGFWDDGAGRWSWAPPLAALVFGVLVGVWAWRKYWADRRPLIAGRGARPRVLHLLDHPGARIEIDSRWPGRTRFRIPSSQPLPLQGPARLTPRSLRGGRSLSRSFGDLVWTGRGADDVARWASVLEEPLRALYGWRDRYTLQATLTPFGLIVHMPLVAPTPAEEPFLLAQAARLAAGLEAMAGRAAPEGVAFGSARVGNAECPTCWEPVGRRFVECDACHARQHPDCAAWTGGCGRFACDGLARLEESAASR